MANLGPCVSRSRAGAVADRPAFAAGELAGGEVTTRGSPQRGGPDAPRTGTGGARKGARWRAWWSGGVAHRRYADSGHGRTRGGAHEVRGGKAVLTRAKTEGKRKREGEIHGAVLLRRERPCSGERFPRKGSLPRQSDTSPRCARWRWCSGQDGASPGERERPEQPTPAMELVRVVAGACAATACVG